MSGLHRHHANIFQQQTDYYCATGPQALASCVCIKSGMSGRISSTVSSYVKWNCDNTATADVTSALDVFAFYCSAAEKEVVVNVTDTATETYPHPTNRITSFSSSPSETGTGSSGSSGGSGGSDNGGSDSDQGGKDGSSSGGNGSNNSSSINKTAVIAACVLGGVVLIAGVAAVAFFVRRKRNKQMRGEQLPPTADGNNLQGPPELENTSKPGPNVAVVPELHSTERQELQGNTGTPFSELPPGYVTARPELQGNVEYKPPLSPDHGRGYQPPQSHYYGQPQGPPTVSPATPSTHGVGWQSGPVAEAYELDSATWKVTSS